MREKYFNNHRILTDIVKKTKQFYILNFHNDITHTFVKRTTNRCRLAILFTHTNTIYKIFIALIEKHNSFS